LHSERDDILPPSADPLLEAEFDRCRRREPEAFTAIYRRFARVVHGIVVAAAGPADAEDLTQEVFMKVHDKIASVRDAHALPGWICTVARHAAVDHTRGRSRRPRSLHLVEEPVDPTVKETNLEAREFFEHVLAVIRSLPESYRETLVLRLVEGLTGPQIAARTGMTHGSVRVNLSRGMAQLRPLLAEKGWS
jgi:RNA polymerase sigma-70 factor, ECF subfamily